MSKSICRGFPLGGPCASLQVGSREPWGAGLGNWGGGGELRGAIMLLNCVRFAYPASAS